MKRLFWVLSFAAVISAALTGCAEEERVIEMTDTVRWDTVEIQTAEAVPQTAAEAHSEAYIEIKDGMKEELLDIIDCYFIMKDIAGGKFYSYGGIIERDMGAEYGEKYAQTAPYAAFEIDREMFDRFQDTFFRNAEDIDFSSDSRAEDFIDTARLYMTDEFAGNTLESAYFRDDEVMEEYSYVSPAYYWEHEDRLYLYTGFDHIGGGENQRDTFRVMGYGETYIIVRVDRYYEIVDLSEVMQYIFTLDGDMWKLAYMDNISADHSYLYD